MKTLVANLKSKRFVQNLIMEVTADLLMLCIGVVIGYYFKTMMF